MVRSKPLTDRRIVVTAPGRLATRLRDLGATVVECPVIAIETNPLGDLSTDRYDWLVFTSANGVSTFCEGLVGSTPLNSSQKVAAVGPATAEALREHGFAVDLVPEEAVAEALVDAFPVGSGRVLLPQAEAARPVLAEGMRAKGWTVDVMIAYKTVAVPLSDNQRRETATADAVAFTSSSTVINYLDGGGAIPPMVVCIGPVTAATAKERGLTVASVAEPHTVDGLVDALVSAL